MRKPKVRFEIRKDKQRKDGTCPVSCIVSFQQRRKRLNTDIYTYPTNWDHKERVAQYVSRSIFKKQNPTIDPKLQPLQSEISEFNDKLSEQKKKINDTVRLIELNGEVLTFDRLIEKLEPTTSNQEALPFSVILTKYIDWYCDKQKNQIKKDSLKVYNQLKMNLISFQKIKKNEFVFNDLSYDFMSEFNDHLIEKRGLFNTTIRKQFSTLNTLINKAKKYGLIINSNYNDFRIKKDDFEVIALERSEYEAIKKVDLSKDHRLDKARDIFVFLCSTGFRYSEYKILRRRNIGKEEIVLTEVKTSEIRSVFLTPDSRSILEKYQSLELPLPQISNAKLNKYIKEVAKKANLDKPLERVRHKGNTRYTSVKPMHELITAHMARKTFITLILEMGVPVETAMAISNHKSYQSFKRYVGVGRDHKKEAMKKAWG